MQKDPFIQMYEERSVDVAGYVCRIMDQMPASPSSPMYMDWMQNKNKNTPIDTHHSAPIMMVAGGEDNKVKQILM